MRVTALAAATLLALSMPATGAWTHALDGIDGEVDARREEYGPVVGKPTKQLKLLIKTDAVLDRDSDSLGGDLKLLGKAAKLLFKAYPGDGEIEDLVGGARDDLRDRVLENRTVVLVEADELPDDKDRASVFASMGRVDSLLTRSGDAPKLSKELKLLRKACGRIEKLAAKWDFRLPSPDVELDPPGPVVADVSMEDVNATSGSFGEEISPRDRLGTVTAWYFGHST